MSNQIVQPLQGMREGGNTSRRRRSVAGIVLGLLLLVLVASFVGRNKRSALEEETIDPNDPSEVAAQIIGNSEGFGRQVDDLRAHGELSYINNGKEEEYPALAKAIVHHGQGILHRLLYGPPPKPMEGIPMPVDDEYPPDPDGIDDPVNIVQTPPPSPPPDFDQGKLASSIIDESNARYLANLKNANTSGKLASVPETVKMPNWKNAGSVAEANAFDFPSSYIPPDSPRRVSSGRNYWHTLGGENTDGTTGALGGSWPVGSTEGTGPKIDSSADNGASAGDGFVYSTGDDDRFHRARRPRISQPSSSPSASQLLGGKSHEVVVNTQSDNGARGESFSFSTAADAFDCGDHCKQEEQRLSNLSARPQALQQRPRKTLQLLARRKPSKQEALLRMEERFMRRRGAAGMDGDSGPAPI
mmetsp:Transcript_28509/g.64658  ORF Transcript_28509/g.64658 Transcript_28509/m.64658 type:complete len:415 (-) Transcript_28509:224-1468(-)